MKKLIAFTLAETLIVMGIIGIVSALTLPNLNSSTGEKEKIAKVKKLYQNLNDALGRAVAVYGPLEEWFVNDTTYTAQITRFDERFTEFMKVSKNCGTTVSNCFGPTLNALTSGSGDQTSDYVDRAVILADGTSIGFTNIGGNYFITIDIDGPNKGKCQYGTDIFQFFIENNNNVIPAYNQNSKSFSDLINNLKTSGYFATIWVINYDNMDYLKLDVNGKCPNGTTPTEQNPRCK